MRAQNSVEIIVNGVIIYYKNWVNNKDSPKGSAYRLTYKTLEKL